MEEIILRFGNIGIQIPFCLVKGTENEPFLFGHMHDQKLIFIKQFYISRFLVTQKLWESVMGSHPAVHKGNDLPVENISFVDIHAINGFLEKLKTYGRYAFRLPTESEWEYAARGGVHWKENFQFSGSNSIDDVAWYKDNSNDESKAVGLKMPNQLGIYDMCGNLWEWCEDYYHEDINNIPDDGSPCTTKSEARVLRGGCFHNWAIHCTSTKRYEIGEQFHDGCIGFRLVFSE